MRLQVALIAGPMYDPLYACLADFAQATGIAVDVSFRGDHPQLNAHLASLAEAPYDLVSTHSKYAPAQQPLLAPLDGALSAEELADFAPRVLDMARISSKLYGLPRNLDVRLLHYRTDLIEQSPQTWDGLLDLARRVNAPPDHYGFVFPGQESGLFGTFFELVEMGGASLFPPNLVPDIMNDGGRWALNLLRTFYREGLVPREIPDWHYDRVHECFRSGHAAMVGDWPGYYGSYCDRHGSAVWDRFALSPYPVGPTGRSLAYGGSHTFALTRSGVEKPEALALLRFLTAPAQQLLEARHGSVPVRRSVMGQMQAEATPSERRRWQILDSVITSGLLVPPAFAAYPRVEDALWHTVQKCMVGEMPVDGALQSITHQIERIVGGADE